MISYHIYYTKFPQFYQDTLTIFREDLCKFYTVDFVHFSQINTKKAHYIWKITIFKHNILYFDYR